jgi:hypothetical protein
VPAGARRRAAVFTLVRGGLSALLLVIVGCLLWGQARERSQRLPPGRTVALVSERAQRMCGLRSGEPATVSHVVWIWMENHALAQIIGARGAGFITSLAASCGLATNYRAVAHPSLPNYIAATSGSTGDIHADGPPARYAQTDASIFGQLGQAAGSYEESMPINCALADHGAYVARHNPEVYYLAVRGTCRRMDLPLGSASAGPFRRALASGNLPAFSFVAPNTCDDMHSCGVAAGDAWLAEWVPLIANSGLYREGKLVLFIAWDENDGAAGNRVPLIVVSSFTRPGTVSRVRFSHYSLLRTTEALLGLHVFLGHAASARSLRASFGL